MVTFVDEEIRSIQLIQSYAAIGAAVPSWVSHEK